MKKKRRETLQQLNVTNLFESQLLCPFAFSLFFFSHLVFRCRFFLSRPDFRTLYNGNNTCTGIRHHHLNNKICRSRAVRDNLLKSLNFHFQRHFERNFSSICCSLDVTSKKLYENAKTAMYLYFLHGKRCKCEMIFTSIRPPALYPQINECESSRMLFISYFLVLPDTNCAQRHLVFVPVPSKQASSFASFARSFMPC